jgi:diacylglycerol kinase
MRMSAFLRGFVHAANGILYTVRTQRNMRVHLVITAVVVLAGAYFRLSAIEWAVIAVTAGLVLSAEMTNTVAELAVDLLTRRYDPMAKAAKDVGAGAVLVTAIAAILVGVAIFGPRLVVLLRS